MFFHLRTIVCIVFGLVAAFMPSFAQEANQEPIDSVKQYQLDDIVITGTRSEKRIIDVPYSIQRIDNTQFKYVRVTGVNDILSSIPGLFAQSRYGNHDVRISIRGFGSRSNSGIRGVRILLDNIPESEPDGQTRIEAIDFNALSSVEVVKGNASSLYTNAPGGVVNFLNDINFQRSHVMSFNEFGEFQSRNTGIKVGVRTEKYGFMTTYTYHNFQGYRSHSQDYWNIVNSIVDLSPGDNTRLGIYGYFVDGLIRLPGSLTRQQFDSDPFQANSRDVARDTKRVTKKGRIGIRYDTFIGDERSHEIDLIGYGTIKYFERTSGTYRFINRNGLGLSGRYIWRTDMGEHRNEFSFGGDVFLQTGPVEAHNNINGMKGDNLQALTDEGISNIGFYLQDQFSLVPERLDILLTGRYDKVSHDVKDQLLGVRSSSRRFEGFTPKIALNYKMTPGIAAFTSYGTGFDTPADNELDNPPTSTRPNVALNPDLNPQKSNNFEAGIKGSALFSDCMLTSLGFEATFFHLNIKDEIVPFDVYGDVFFRNAARTSRTGLELGLRLALLSGLKLDGTYTFSNFSYDDYVARSIDIDSVGNLVTAERNFTGNSVPSVPKHNLNLAVSYTHNLTEQITGFIRLGSMSVSGMYVNDANAEKTSAYTLLNGTVGVDILFDKLSFLVSGGLYNIADKRYVAFININAAGGDFYELGTPRNFFANIKLGYTP